MLLFLTTASHPLRFTVALWFSPDRVHTILFLCHSHTVDWLFSLSIDSSFSYSPSVWAMCWSMEPVFNISILPSFTQIFLRRAPSYSTTALSLASVVAAQTPSDPFSVVHSVHQPSSFHPYTSLLSPHSPSIWLLVSWYAGLDPHCVFLPVSTLFFHLPLPLPLSVSLLLSPVPDVHSLFQKKKS